MTEAFVGVYDSSTCICLSRQSSKMLIEHGESSEEYEDARQNFKNWWNSIEEGKFTMSPDASYVSYDGIDLRGFEAKLDQNILENLVNSLENKEVD